MEDSSNPYESPDSEVHYEGQVKTSKNAWKVFFVVALLIHLLMMIFFVSETNQPFIEAVDIVVYSLLLWGVYGFAYNKRFVNRYFWVLIFALGVSWEVYTYLESDLLTSNIFLPFIIIIVAFNLLLYGFQLYGLFRYCFKSTEIWDNS